MLATPAWVVAVLRSRVTTGVARSVLTLPYWWSAIDKCLHPAEAIAEVAALGVAVPLLAYLVLVTVQLIGSVMIICDWGAWFGAGALAVCTLIVTLLAHAFWIWDGQRRADELSVFLEHLALTAGLVFAAQVAQPDRAAADLGSSPNL